MRLQLLDVFAKPAEDARVRTSSGGIVTLVTFAVLSWLVFNQLRAYWALSWDHKLVIDSSLGSEMAVYLDMSFWDLPCDLLNIDSIDENNVPLLNLDDVLTKVDLDANGEPLSRDVFAAQQKKRDDAISQRDASYEGSCFGAEDGLRRARGLAPDAPVKCMTCEDVRVAYAELLWKFDDGRGFAQCVEEGYPERVQENMHNGCRVTGLVRQPKVGGQLHFAPGESSFVASRHTHDLSTYDMASAPYTFRHTVHALRFGDAHMDEHDITPWRLAEYSDALDPLRGHVSPEVGKQHQFRYYLNIVGTQFHYASGERYDTNQYSVTVHDRPLEGGRDESHPNSVHRAGGIPGIWLAYRISPMKVVETEIHELSFGMLVMNVLAIVGAVITSAAVVDKGVYAVDQALKARKQQ